MFTRLTRIGENNPRRECPGWSGVSKPWWKYIAMSQRLVISKKENVKTDRIWSCECLCHNAYFLKLLLCYVSHHTVEKFLKFLCIKLLTCKKKKSLKKVEQNQQMAERYMEYSIIYGNFKKQSYTPSNGMDA